jgi:hypothetical protein
LPPAAKNTRSIGLSDIRRIQANHLRPPPDGRARAGHAPLVHDAYHQKDYSGALGYALLVNLPGQFWTHLVVAMVHGQLGNRDAAADAARTPRHLSGFPDHAKQELEMFFFLERAHVEHVLEGLRKAGLTLTEGAGSE